MQRLLEDTCCLCKTRSVGNLEYWNTCPRLFSKYYLQKQKFINPLLKKDPWDDGDRGVLGVGLRLPHEAKSKNVHWRTQTTIAKNNLYKLRIITSIQTLNRPTVIMFRICAHVSTSQWYLIQSVRHYFLVIVVIMHAACRQNVSSWIPGTFNNFLHNVTSSLTIELRKWWPVLLCTVL